MPAEPPTVRVVIADEQGMFRQGLKAILHATPDLRVVGEASRADEAVHLVEQLGPDVLLLDLGPGEEGLAALRALAAGDQSVRTILLTTVPDPERLVGALQLGARGVLAKSEDPALLPRCIRSVMGGELWVARDLVGELVRHLPPPAERRAGSRGPSLTPREREVMARVVAGCTNRDIAGELGITEDTVKRHLGHIFDKVGVSNRLELALLAVNRSGG